MAGSPKPVPSFPNSRPSCSKRWPIPKAETRAMPALEAVRSAEAQVFERRSVVDERVLLREALIAGRGLVALDGLKVTLEGREGQGSLIRKGTEVASREGLETEKELIVWARQGGQVGALGHLGPDRGSRRGASDGRRASPSFNRPSGDRPRRRRNRQDNLPEGHRRRDRAIRRAGFRLCAFNGCRRGAPD
jgi:hypothetical protein